MGGQRMMVGKNNLGAITGLLLLVLLLSAAAHAAQSAASLTVSVNVDGNCTASTQSLNFGNPASGDINSNPTDAEAVLSVNCSTGTPFQIDMDAGLQPSGCTSARCMSNGADLLPYNIYLDAARTQVWGTSVGGTQVDGVGVGSPEPHTIYGRIFQASNPNPGIYTDTVTITITF